MYRIRSSPTCPRNTQLSRTPENRLSENLAHDAPEWRLPLGVRGEKDGLPCSLGNEYAEPPSGTRISGFPTELKERTDYTSGRRRTRRRRRRQKGRRTRKTQRTRKGRRTTTAEGTGTAWFPRKQPTSGERRGTVTHAHSATPQEGRG
ncbi:hypothetical protein NDU88_003082 [Pleurodeles waltl]|uniref:Uncharacterized protein n=1 Tax=Pleurodeles waltl TaxID=8319 RepID=A0AAV7MTJ6_PLEWA|nr:hypothetical protein NDU88_003082 [Pleurodeles waltl]